MKEKIRLLVVVLACIYYGMTLVFGDPPDIQIRAHLFPVVPDLTMGEKVVRKFELLP